MIFHKISSECYGWLNKQPNVKEESLTDWLLYQADTRSDKVFHKSFTRTASFDILCNNYYVSTQNKAIGIVVCNYVKDSVINSKDSAAILRYTIESNIAEDYCYDIDNDGAITDADKAYYQEFISTTSNLELVLYTNWR